MISAAIMLSGCGYNLMSSPHTVIKYDQVGETCVYSEEFGEHMLDLTMSGAEQLFYVRLGKNEAHFANTRCEKLIDRNQGQTPAAAQAPVNAETNAVPALEEKLTLNDYYMMTTGL